MTSKWWELKWEYLVINDGDDDNEYLIMMAMSLMMKIIIIGNVMYCRWW